MPKRFIWTGLAVAVEADTLDEATELLEDQWEADQWHEVAPHIELFTPAGPPEETEEDEESECICPAGLVARGGFRSGCPVHA
jgi:hypothetical protein